ncbi:MAG: tetratricopeptide repeat protein [Pyrinomonadaceae bacterium]
MKISTRHRHCNADPSVTLTFVRSFKTTSAGIFLAIVFILIGTASVRCQLGSGDHTVYGDLTVDESKATGLKPLTFDVILYIEGGVLVSRQTVSSNGRYRFNNLAPGGYQLAIEVEATEVARVTIDLRSPLLKDVRRDVALEWKGPSPSLKTGTVSIAENYVRSSKQQKLFKVANDASSQKRYVRAVSLLQQIVATDAKDFPAWTELANNHFLQKKFEDAENEYLRALDTHPGYFLALLNLGRLELTAKKYEVAAAALTKAVREHPDSPDANYFAGEAYLQLKKGSIAVPYLTQAVRLDPSGMAEVRLRLATLYHAAGLKDKAAAEYTQFLKQRPYYRDRKKLERYIVENQKARAAG